MSVIALAACGAPNRGHVTQRHLEHRRSEPRTTVLAIGPARQRFEGWGASVVTETRIDPLADPRGLSAAQRRRMDALVFGAAGIRLLRIWSPAFGFGGRARALRVDDGRFALMRRAATYGVRFVLTGADAPARLKSRRSLRRGAERAYAVGLAQVLRFAHDRVGVPFSYVAVGNEVDNPRMPLTMSPAQASVVYTELARLIHAHHLHTGLLLGDNTGWPVASRYVADELERRPTGVVGLASHAYGGNDADRRAFAARATASRVPVWMTEWTHACAHGECRDDERIGFALTRATEIVRDLTAGSASRWFLFRAVSDTSHGADDGLLVRDRRSGTVRAGTRFAVFRQFSVVARAGVRVHVVRERGARVPAVAFAHGRDVGLVVVNLARRARPVVLALGPGVGRLDAWRTSAAQRFAALPALSYDGHDVATTLPPASASTFLLRRQ